MRKDLKGKRFSRLVAETYRPKIAGSRAGWVCKCDCGVDVFVATYVLTGGKQKSCGCYKRDNPGNLRHGMANTAEYGIYKSMLARCENQNVKCYQRYGGRGVRVCAEWKDSFQAFIDYMGPRPTKRHSVGRIDNNGNYEPGNVRWETPEQQGANLSTNRLITVNGETKTITEWARATGIEAATLRRRVIDLGWNTETALTTPTRSHKAYQRRGKE